MKKKRDNTLSFLLMVALFFGLLFAMDSSVHAATLTSESREWAEDSTITEDVTINGGVSLQGDITLTIPEGKTLTVNGEISANGYTLTVSGDGTLNVTGSNGSSGGDVNDGNDGIKGNLTVNGGIITITGGNGGNSYTSEAGGKGGYGISGNVTVNGGAINITGGSGGSGGHISHSENDGEGCDGGKSGYGINGDVTVNGGTITITGGKGGKGGYGMGSGKGGSGSDGGYGISGNVTVNGGAINITGGSGSDGNSGSDGVSGSDGGYGISGNVTVNGGTITITGGSGSDGGNGDATGVGGNGGTGGNGINGSLTVNGGTITTTGGTGGTGGLGNAAGEDGKNGQAVTGTITASNGVTLEESDNNSTWSDVSSGNTSSKRYVKTKIIWTKDFTITEDVTINSDVFVSGDITLTIPEGKTLTVNGTINAAGYTLTVSGDGTLNVTGSNGRHGVEGNLTVNGGTITITGGNGNNGKAVTGTITASTGITVEESEDGSNWTSLSSGATSTKRYVRVFHAHNFTYTVSGNTITATCSNEGCTLTDNKATLTIEPSSSGGGTAELSGDVSEFEGVSNDDITYQAKDSTGWNDIDSSKITNQGFYKASIKFGTLTASITYGVNAITKGTGAANGCDFTVPTVAYVGAKIKPELTLATGYEVKKITVTDTAKNIDVSTSVGADTEGFTMPEYNITVSIEFGKINYTVACSSTNGTLTANNATAQYEDTVTLTATPNSGYELKSFTVKDSANNDVDFTTKDNTATFTMPASNVTATATFEAKSFGITISSTITNGTLTAAATTAKYGSEVTLTVSPNTGYEVSSVTVKQNTSNTSVTVTKVSDTSYKFTVPADNVTVSAEFAKRNVSVSAQLTGNSGTTCDAVLMDESYNEVSDTLTKKLGEKFILKVLKQEGYGFNFTFSTGDDANEYVEEFSQDKYLEYIEYARENEISLPSNMYLFQVTMPGVAADSMKVNVTFSKVKNFTILYQTTNAPKAVWCKFIVVDNGKETSYVTSMKNDAAMGDGTAVWSLKTEAAFDPTKVAFLEGESNADIDNATVTDVSVIQTAPTASDWTSIANNGGKFCVIGGDAKTFIASFVADGSSVTVYDSDTVEADTAENSDGVIYRVAVCLMDSNGNVTTAGTVTAPTNTYTKTGYNFAGWRGFEGTAPNLTEKIYNAGDSISINTNTTVSAVWNIKTASITLNRNGGTGGSNVSSVTYGSRLTLSQNPTKKGYTFDGWTVSETVTENGTLFAKGSLFDFSTPITTDLKLTAQWKHVHSYTVFRITDFPELTNYHKYDSSLHVDVCGCANVKLTAHKFDSNGKCSCGYTKPSSTNATLNVSYGQWANGKYTVKMQGLPETVKKNQEVSINAPKKWGSLQFSRWQYTTDNTTWADLTADAYASFILPCNMTVRALYVNPVTKPQVNLNARLYADSAVVNGTTYTMDNILFNMNYQLPDGYTFVDAGIRLGDNGGIAYYELKERTYTTDAGGKAMLIGITAVLDTSGLKDLSLSETETYYEEHKNSVLDEMSAETLAKYMYESKPINMEKYPPIYWEAKAVTKGMSGSMATIPPLRFAQKDNGNHYIYGIAYLRYKNSSGKTNTIYTPALPATINNVPSNTVSKEGN